MTTMEVRADWPQSLAEEVFLLPVHDSPSLGYDPSGFMACALSRAKWWLAQCDDILHAYSALGISVDYLAEVKRRGYNKSVLLDAEEMRRRCEHKLGRMIIDGQEAGVFNTASNEKAISLMELLGLGKRYAALNRLRNPGRVLPPDFEAALVLAREEGILTLANVTRLVKNEDIESDRSEWQYRKRRIDSNKVISTLADQLDALRSGLDLVIPEDLDEQTKLEALESISDSLAFMKKEMKKW